MGESCPKLLDLIPKETEWGVNREAPEERRKGSSCDENKKLELRLGLGLGLGLPGDERWSQKNSSSVRERNESIICVNHFHDQKQRLPNNNHNPWPCSGYQMQAQQQQSNNASPYLNHHQNHQYHQTGPNGLPVMAKESSQPCCTIILDLQNAEQKAFSSASANTAVPNTSQSHKSGRAKSEKTFSAFPLGASVYTLHWHSGRAAPVPVVGWPPIRSFRKNLASTSSAKPVSELQNPIQAKPINEKTDGEKSHKGVFVKINMDGVPIGRKVDLNVYDTYEKLSSAVDELFGGLLAAQRDSPIDKKHEEQKPITGLLDGSGEYTLVYEDNEGDRMLVGDVPWHMFVSTVKRLRVLKTSDLPTLGWRISKENKPHGGPAAE